MLHRPCKSNCERRLICGHLCNTTGCHENCPPCNKKCDRRCIHSICNHMCWEECRPCKEKCPFPGCKKLCSDICYHEKVGGPEPNFQTDRCDFMLGCGHQCFHLKNHQQVVKFHGEIDFHSKQACPICNKIDIQDRYLDVIMQCFSDDELYIHLPDCHHSIAVTSLDKHVEVLMEDSEVKMLTCPKPSVLR